MCNKKQWDTDLLIGMLEDIEVDVSVSLKNKFNVSRGGHHCPPGVSSDEMDHMMWTAQKVAEGEFPITSTYPGPPTDTPDLTGWDDGKIVIQSNTNPEHILYLEGYRVDEGDVYEENEVDWYCMSDGCYEDLPVYYKDKEKVVFYYEVCLALAKKGIFTRGTNL